MKRYLSTLLAALGLAATIHAQTHPRLFFDAADVPAIRAKAATPEFAPVLTSIQAMIDGGDPYSYEFHKSFGNHAILHLATGLQSHADAARDETLYHISQTQWWANNGYKSLRRGALSRGAALCYDFCYDAWAGQTVPATVTWKGVTYNIPSQYVGMDLRQAVSQAIKANADSLNASGGGEWPGDTALGNNWFGVRFGGAILGFLACDEAGADTGYNTALGRFVTYLETAHSKDPAAKGWNPEGHGYITYPAQFSFPAIRAIQRLKGRDLTAEIPALKLALPALFHSMLPLNMSASGFKGVHPDWVDDNPDWLSEGASNLAFAFAPASQLPALKYIYDRSLGSAGDNKWDATSCGGLYALLYYPHTTTAQNPATVPGWGLHYSDPVWGMFKMRKSYAGDLTQDVIAQFYAKNRNGVGGHNAPDGLGFRISGLGLPWVCGSGRTISPGGQSTVFPSDPDVSGYQGQTHLLLDSYLRDGGGGYVVAKGQPFNDVGVRNHTRRFLADYGAETGAAGVFIVSDSSETGRYWRLNTPGKQLGTELRVNTIATSGDTFTITNAATGHRLVGKVLHPAGASLRTGEFVRGSAMSFNGLSVERNNWVDFQSTDGQFVVALALVENGQPVPAITTSGSGVNRTISVGTRTYTLNGNQITVSGWERPTVAITSPADGTVFTGGAQTIALTGTASSPASTPIDRVEMTVDGAPAGNATLSGGTWSFTTASLAMGTRTITARAVDANLEWSEATVKVLVSQTQPPQIAIHTPAPTTELAADSAAVLKGRASDPDAAGSVGVEVFEGETSLGTTTAGADGSWAFSIPGADFTLGLHTYTARATDAAGDTRDTAPLTLTASRRYSPVPFFGDLANWTRSNSEWRVFLADDAGNTRYSVIPSSGYTYRNADSCADGRSFDGDFHMSFKAKVNTASSNSALKVIFGRDVYLTLGSGTNYGGLRYTGWGDKPIGSWNQAFFPDNNWHDVEIIRSGDVLTIRRDGTDWWSLTLNPDRSFTDSPSGMVTWDYTFGARDKYRWYVNYWGPGRAGIGANFADTTSFWMDDFNVTEPGADQPPAVAVTAPANNATFSAGQVIAVSGTASDPENAAVSVELFAGSERIATPAVSGGAWSFNWTPPANGVYSLYARATDAKGNISTTPAVMVFSGSSGNTAPSCAITAPANNSSFNVNTAQTISASATDADGLVTSVAFLINGTLHATDATAPFSASWTPAATGSYTLTAVATDDLGATSTSPVVNVTVTANNVLPVCTLTAPANNSSVTLPATITMTATASDTSPGSVARVEFFDGTTLLGQDTSSPYSFDYVNPPAGTRPLKAVAVDNDGGRGNSAIANLTVIDPNNALPTVTLTSPANNSSFTPPAVIPLAATASDTDGTISRVEFYAGATLLGTDTTAPFEYGWANAPVGNHAFTAKAYDDKDASATSTAVNATVSLPAGSSLALNPEADTWARTGVATNYGTSTKLQVKFENISVREQAYLRFNLAPFAGRQVLYARLRLLADGSRPNQKLAFQPDDTWGELTLNGTNMPAYTAGPEINPNFSSIANTYVDLDVTSQVQAEAAGDGRISFTVASGEAQAMSYYSREALGTSSRPVLEVIYNQRPAVTLGSPLTGTLHPPGTEIPLAATATDADGSVAEVRFYVDNVQTGVSLTSAPYTGVWTPVVAGTYQLRAEATDNLGAVGQSATASVHVTGEGFSAPSISSIADQTVAENGSTGPLAFTISDAETPAASLTVSAVSSNTAVVPQENLVLSGSGSSRAITAAPATGAGGSATITLTVSDGVLTATETFTVTVDYTPAGTRIVISPASAVVHTGASQAFTATLLDQHGAPVNPQPAFTWSVLPAAGTIATNGTFTAAATPGTAWQAVTATAGTFTGTAGVAVIAPPAVVQLNFMDGTDGASSVSTIGTTTWTSLTSKGGLPSVANLKTSANTDSGIAFAMTNALQYATNDRGEGGTTTSGTAADGLSSYSSTGVTVTDGGRFFPWSVIDSFNAVHEGSDAYGAMTFATAEAKSYKFWVASSHDENNPGENSDRYAHFNVGGSYTLASRSFTGGATLTLNANNRQGTDATADNNSTGDTTLKYHVGKLGGSSGIASTYNSGTGKHEITFQVGDASSASGVGPHLNGLIVEAASIPPVNTAPTISTIAHQTIGAGSTAGPLAFTIGDAETAATSLSVTAVSSNGTLLPSGGIALGGSGANRTLTLTPAAAQNGLSTVTVFVSDGILSATTSFSLTVNPPAGGFASWIATQSGVGAQTGPQQDPDADGIPNLIEYALSGGAAGTPNASIRPTASFTSDAGNNYLTLTIQKNPTASGITLSAETCGDLSSWQSGPGHTVVVSETTETLIVRDATPVTGATRRFIRLKVTQP